MIIVVCGPGGVGKGTVVGRLVAGDPGLLLSRSWTTRARRPREGPDAYTFVTPEEFCARERAGGFLETNEFGGNLYGTPCLDAAEGRDVVLEIDVNGAEQVRARYPDAVVILLVPPSPEVQAERLRLRGDSDEQVAARVAMGEEETRRARLLADHIVVNDDLERAVAELAGIIQAHRAEGD